MPESTFRAYLNALRGNLALGNATEHTHRPALKTLLESIAEGVTATNEPSHTAVGAPDYVVSRTGGSQLTIGYVEAKDIGASLDQAERSEQLKRYRSNLPNLLLTNYTEFRWYVDGERRMTALLAERDGSNKLTSSVANVAATEQLLDAFLRHMLAPVTSAEEMAERMAQITRMVRDVVYNGLESGGVSQLLQDFYGASESVLAPGQEHAEFADMFAQTLAYGLFAARIYHDLGTFYRQSAAYKIPAANPFLQTLFSTVAGPSLDSEPFVGFVDDLVGLLRNADMQAVLADFGARGPFQDPIPPFLRDILGTLRPRTTGAPRRLLHTGAGCLLHRALSRLVAARPLRVERRAC